MADYSKIIPWLLYQEDDKRVPGKIVNLGDGAGMTRLGITSNNFGSYVPDTFFTTMGFQDAVGCAKILYKNQYWNRFNGDKIQSDEVAAIILSFAVNRNIRISVSNLPKRSRKRSKRPGAKVEIK